VEKPMLYRACDGVIIAGGSLIGVGLFLAIFVFVMFCNYRSKARNGAYLGMGFPPQIQPVQPIFYPYQQGLHGNYSNPVIVYSDQPNYLIGQTGQAGVAVHQINHSENQ
jgi:hypothetical protein